MSDVTQTTHPAPPLTPPLGLVLAMASNGVIGRGGDLPWHLPKDLKHFKRLTLDHPILMGRKTWDSIGRPLPRRRSLVLSRDPQLAIEGAEVFGTLEDALAATDGQRIFVIGGAALFETTLPKATDLHLTRVHAEVEGDVRLSSLDLDGWRRSSAEDHPADDCHAFPFTFEHWQRP